MYVRFVYSPNPFLRRRPALLCFYSIEKPEAFPIE